MAAAISLVVTKGKFQGKEYYFDDRAICLIGRAEDCDIRLPSDLEHAAISRHHCAFTINPPRVRVRDLGSRNGTCVNGQKIGQRATEDAPEDADLRYCPELELKDGDEVQLGAMALRVRVLPAPVGYATAMVETEP